ncbi:MAG: ABC transporter ATP-binding protein [Candidatus Margulisiibacteriota bacterium]|jgi:subfamily B ATP-binding cassette protein MsbA
MKTYFRVLSYLRKYWPYLIGVLICVAVYTASTLLMMPLVRNITSSVGSGSISHFQNWIVDAVLLFLFLSLAKYGQNYWMALVGYRMLMDLRIQIFKNLQQLSMDFYANWRVGELISRTTNDTTLVQNTIVDVLAKLLPNFLTATGVLIYLFRINAKYTLAVIIIIPVYALFVGKIGGWLRNLSMRSREKLADIIVILQETLSNIRLVKAFTNERYEIKKYTVENTKNLRLEIQQVRISELRDPVMSFLNVLIVIFVFWLGGQEVINGTLTYDRLAEFLTGIALLPGPILAIGQVYINIQQSMVGAERFFELIDMKPSVKEKKNAVKLQNISGHVKFENLSFAYPQSEEILKNIELDVEPGQLVAIVGRSGAGKTTLVNMLPRFYDPTSGRILLDGYDIKDLAFSSLRNCIGIVTQENMLFNGTIKENIAYGNMSASEEQLIEAAKVANAHQFISLFPDGYDTFVGDRGVRLSGGQQQRLSIARAVLRDPRILILDEATSSLDSESEKLVQEALERLMKSRTTFVIAHRLSTVLHANKIIVLEDGRIVESGTHSELIAHAGTYKTLYDMQFKV